jgi:hypothetical protein
MMVQTARKGSQTESAAMSIEWKLIEEPLGNPDSARLLCEASELAYLPEAEGTRAYAERLGLSARLFSVGNTQAWLAVDEANIVVWPSAEPSRPAASTASRTFSSPMP